MTHAGAHSAPARLRLAETETRSDDISDLTRRTRATRRYTASFRDASWCRTSRYPLAYRTVKIKPSYCERICLDVTHTLALAFIFRLCLCLWSRRHVTLARPDSRFPTLFRSFGSFGHDRDAVCRPIGRDNALDHWATRARDWTKRFDQSHRFTLSSSEKGGKKKT